MKAAIMVLFEDPSARRLTHTEWIMAGLIARNVRAQTYSLDLNNPEIVKSALGRIVDFAYGRVHNGSEPPGELNFRDMPSPEDVSFLKQLRKALGPAIRQGAKSVWYGKERLAEMEKSGKETG